MHGRAKIPAKRSEAKIENSISKGKKSGLSQSTASPIGTIMFLQRNIGNWAFQRLFKSGIIQAKLRIGQPGDKYEQEADRVAEQVISMPKPQMQRQREEEEEPIQTKKQVGGKAPLAGHNLETRIRSLRGGGRALSESVRTRFEPSFGCDFSRVRLHTDAQAAETAQMVNARAFTVGKDVVFAAGQYAPETIEGKKLLAHELSHVVQQHVEGLSDKKSFNRPMHETILRKNGPQKEITYKVSPGTETENPAIIWRQNGNIIAILEFDNNENLNRYLRGEVTDDELVAKKHALWTYMPIEISKDALPKPHAETKVTGVTDPKEEAISELEKFVEKVRSSLERTYIKGLLYWAAASQQWGADSQAQSAIEEAAETAIVMLKRKTAALDVQSAKKEMVRELIKTAGEVQMLGGDDEAAESAVKKALVWAEIQLDRAVERLRVTPTEAAGKEVAEKAGTVMLLGGDPTEEVDLLMTHFPPSTREVPSGKSK